VAVDIVGVDHAAAAELVTHHLLDRHGCRDITFVGGFTEADVRHGDRETVRQRFAGASAAIGRAMPLIRTDLTPAGAYRAVTAALGRAVPDAFVVGTYGQAFATIRAVADAGLTVPHDVRVVTFDGGHNDHGVPRLTAAQQPVDEIVRRALGDLLEGRAAGAGPLTAALRVGDTCGC
jgi:LacI family transcriptional regulator